MTAFQSWQLADSRKGHIDFSFLKEIYCMHMPKSKSELSSEEVSLSCITNNTFVYNTLVCFADNKSLLGQAGHTGLGHAGLGVLRAPKRYAQLSHKCPDSSHRTLGCC